MDYHGLKRKELQALCKKHGIPANLKNLDMANRLSSLLKEENATKRGKSCLKNLDDDKVLEDKAPKRVKFSPQNETFVFEKTDPRKLRLLARNTRASRKSQLEENPVLVAGIVHDDHDDDVLGHLEKPAKRTSRRKSVVSDEIAGLDTEDLNKLVRRTSRRKSVVPDPITVSDTENVDKPVQRASRRKSVVPDSTAVSDTENVDKPVQRVSRRKSVVADTIAVSDTETVDKPVQKVSRRKSVVPDPIEDTENVLVDKPVQRVSRRSVVSKSITVADTKVVDEVEKPAGGILRSKASTVEVDQVGKPTGRNSRRMDSTVEVDEVVSSEVEVGNDVKPIQRLSRRKSVVGKPIGVMDTDIAVKVDKPAQRNMKRKGVLPKQDAILVTEIVNEMEKTAKRKMRSVVVQSSVDKVEEPAHNGKEDHLEDVLMSPAVNNAKRSREGQELVGQGAVEEVDRPPDELVGLVGENSMRAEMVTVIPENGDNSILADDGEGNMPLSLVKNAETQGDTTMASEGQKIEEVLDQAIDEKNAEGKPPDMVEDIKKPKQDDMNAENFMEAAGFLTNSSENHLTVQSEDCLEEMKGIDKTPKIEVEVSKTPISHGSLNIRNSDEHVAENSLQSNKVEESHETSLHQIADDEISDEGPATAPPSLLKINIDGALCGSMEEKTSAAGEPTCSSSLKSNIIGNSKVINAEEKQSSSLVEMMDNGIYGSIKGHECYNQIKNEELGGQEKGCETSPCLSNSAKNEDTADDGKSNCAAVSFKTLEVQSTKQDRTDGSTDIISEETVVGPIAVTEVDVQPPIVDGMPFSSNVLHATINKILEEAKDIDTVTPLANQKANFSAYLLQSLNKDDGEGKTEASSTNTFLLNLESKIADTMRLLSVPMRKGEECGQEILRGDIACVASSSIRVKNLTENSPINPEQLNEMDMKLEVEGDDFINCAEGNEMKYEKAIKVTKQNSCDLSNGGETPVVFQERNWAQVAGKINISPGPVLVMDEDIKSVSYCDRSNPMNFKEREVSDASHPGSAVSCLDVGNICFEVSEQIAATDTSVTKSDQKFHLKDDTSFDRSTIPQQEILQPLETLCSTFVAPSCSMVEEDQKSTTVKEHSKGKPIGGLTCSANDANLEYAAEDRECVTVMKPEEAHCSNEFKSECVVSEEDIIYHDQTKEQPCSTEDFTVFDNLAAQAYSVAKEMENFSQETGHINEAEGARSPENKSPESTNCNELDEVLGTEFDWQTKSAGIIKKEFKNDPEQLGSFEGTLENGLGSQSTFLITVPEGSESNDGNQREKVCLMEDIDSKHIAGYGNASNIETLEKDSCVVENGHPELKEGSDSVKTSPCTIYKMDSITENLVPRESNSPAYKDDTDELESAKSPDLRVAQDDKGCSVISGEKQACILQMFSAPSSESLFHNTVRNEEFVDVSGVHEMVLEASTDNPFKLLEQETDDGNQEPHFEDGRVDVVHAGRGPNSPAICENKVKDSSEEIAYSHPAEEHDKLAEGDINKHLEMQFGSDFNHYGASDNRAETDFSSPCVLEIFTDQLQQQNHSPLMPSNQRVNPSESAYQADTISTTLRGNGNMKPDVESFIYTDSEMDLFWGEMEKDEVRTSQIEVSDAAFSVNEYEIANPENDCERQETVRESDAEVGNNQKSIIVEESENSCPLDANNSGKMAEKDKVLLSSMVRRKNTRSILIHGTPKKPVTIVHDMKENPPTQKRVQMVNATAVKPNFRRKALDDIAK